MLVKWTTEESRIQSEGHCDFRLGKPEVLGALGTDLL